MSKEDERMWNIIGAVIICIALIVSAFSLGRHTGAGYDRDSLDLYTEEAYKDGYEDGYWDGYNAALSE